MVEESVVVFAQISVESRLMAQNRFTIYDLRFTDYRLRITAITLLAAVFRTHALFANSFHADEALFASWARLIAVWRDPLLVTVPVDKPPLLFYLQALFFPMQGPVEWAARLPNFIASIVLVPLVSVLVLRWWGDEKTDSSAVLKASVFAAFLVAVSPIHIQFSATAFTDPLLTVLLVSGLVASGKWQVASRGGKPATCNQQPATHGLSLWPCRRHKTPGLALFTAGFGNGRYLPMALA